MAKIRLNTQAIAGSLTNTQVASDAGIDYSKLDLVGQIGTTDLNFTIPADTGGTWVDFIAPAGTINGTNDIYTVATAPKAWINFVVLNGVKLRRVAAATDNTEEDTFYQAATADTLFTVGNPPVTGDYIETSYII